MPSALGKNPAVRQIEKFGKHWYRQLYFLRDWISIYWIVSNSLTCMFMFAWCMQTQYVLTVCAKCISYLFTRVFDLLVLHQLTPPSHRSLSTYTAALV